MSWWTDTTDYAKDYANDYIGVATGGLVKDPLETSSSKKGGGGGGGTPSVNSNDLSSQISAQGELSKQQNVANYNAAIASQPGMTPFAQAMGMGNNLATANQNASANTNALIAQTNYNAAATNAGIQAQYDIAQKQIDAQNAASNKQMFGQLAGGVAGGIGSYLGAAALGAAVVCTEESKNVITDGSALIDGTVDSQDLSKEEAAGLGKEITTDMLEDLANRFGSSASIFTRKPGTHGYQGPGLEAGPIMEQLQGNPIADSMIETNENGDKQFNPSKFITAQNAVIGHLNNKINSLTESLGKSNPASMSDAVKSGGQAIEATKKAALDSASAQNELSTNYAKQQDILGQQQQQNVSNYQKEQAAYGQKMDALKQQFPTMSYQTIESHLDSTQNAMKAASFIFGGISQGLLHTANNPGVDTYYKSMDNMIAKNEQDYKKSLFAIQQQHGSTLDGLKLKYDVTEDQRKLINEQFSALTNTIKQSSQYATDAAQAQTGYAALMTTQQNWINSNRTLDLEQQKINLQKQALDTKIQAQPFQIAVNTGKGVENWTARSEKAAETLNTKLPDIDNKLSILNRTLGEFNGGRVKDPQVVMDNLQRYGLGDKEKNDLPGEYDIGSHWYKSGTPREQINNVHQQLINQMQILKDEKKRLLDTLAIKPKQALDSRPNGLGKKVGSLSLSLDDLDMEGVMENAKR